MSHYPTLYQRLEDIDRLVEEVAQNPDRADTVKDALRARLAGDNVHPVTPKRAVLETADPDDYWDNVPI